MRFREEVRRRRDQHHLGALHIERKLDVDAGLVLGVFLQAFERVFERRSRDTQVVADAVDLANDFVRVFLTESDRVHDLARCHGDLGGVYAVGTKDRTAPAL